MNDVLCIISNLIEEIFKSFDKSSPDGTADGWGADKAIQIVIETEEFNNVIAVSLNKQLETLKFSKYDKNIQLYINNFNKIITMIMEKEPNFFPPYMILNKFLDSLQKTSFHNPKTLCIAYKWDLSRLQA